MKKWLLLLICLFVITGCSSKTETTKQSEPSETKNKTGGELHVAINTQPSTLDAQVTTATIVSEVSRNIYEQLVALNSSYQIVPMLAETVDESEDGKTYTFHLRKGVKFHNEKEMKAEDVVASLNKWKEISTKAQAVIPEAAFEQVDEYTVTMNLPKRVYGAITLLADVGQMAVIMPKEIAETADVAGATEYIGTGPFKFVEWKQDQYIHFTKYEDYIPVDLPADGLSGKKEALVDDIFFHIITDNSIRVSGVQTGQYDIGIALPPDNYDMLNNDKNIKTEIDLMGPVGLIYNKEDRIFANAKMRQAVNAALDMESIMLAAYSNEKFFRLDHGHMVIEQKEWYSEAGKDRYNINDTELAKKLLNEAGYNGEEIRILTTRDYDWMYNSAVVIKEQLDKIGVSVKLDVIDWATLIDLRAKPTEYDAFITAFPKVMTPPQILYLGSKWPGWTNDEEITKQMEEINSSTSKEEAKQAWDNLQDRMYDYLPISKFGDYYLFYGISKKVEGMTFLDGMMLWNTSKSE
ncbi:ABC transporter substrate-binding protein [Cytobacillus depressus]|uniref:ABC transporter substrate-binding protein n=1 Tax=Cytobacillus depressus TaxID=1602942 RepID=A0A6L3VDD0_9BACI|nr:ABC transporter substrate-binding protein [Cytobacillus depressus]KAB2338597.1 ABC transporter substrate-binding protein [Cytobacillus depressus]